MDETKQHGKWIPTALAVLTLLATIATSVPSFISLKRDRPSIYYDVQDISVLNAHSPNYRELLPILKAKGIPTGRLMLNLRNVGDVEAKEVEVGVHVPGEIAEILTLPKASDQPVWVDLPKDIERCVGTAVVSIKVVKMAPPKPLNIDFGYFRQHDSRAEPAVDVVFDGRPAKRVDNVGEIARPTMLSYFAIPAAVFGIGIVVSFLSAVMVVVANNREQFDNLVNIIEMSARIYKMFLI